MHFSGKMVSTVLTYTKLGMKINYQILYNMKVYNSFCRFVEEKNQKYCYILFFL